MNARTKTSQTMFRNSPVWRSLCLSVGLAVWLCSGQLCAAEEQQGAATPIDFNAQIRPIFTQYCSSCHGGVKQAGELSFVHAEGVLPPDGWVIEPGDPEASVLIERVKTDDPDIRMPPPDEHEHPLPAKDIALLEQWIKEGAEWGDPWSLAPLRESSGVIDSDWARRPLDRLVVGRLVDEGMAPSADASPAEWLRRVSFDLIGLPPTVEQLDVFIRECNEASGPAEVDEVYARNVDRLLASSRFGERWASVWMDLARYADSMGFEKDPHRDMWPYRDWLIRAFNADMPYDEFTTRQLAGDLLPDPTADDLIATAFHRNTQTNTEGGTNDEEFRVAAVIDRINTTWTVWQATTFGCVQCHSHPYDPIKHEEYYAFMALLNNTLDVDLNTDFPTLKIPSDSDQREEAIAMQDRFQTLRHDRNRLGRDLATDVPWTSLTPTSVTSSHGELAIEENHVRRSGGTFPVGVSYTVETQPTALTALRIDILPESEDPAKWPEQGSVLSHLTAKLIKADGTESKIEVADVFVDAITGPDDASECLKKSSKGVGGYPKLHQPHWAVMVLKQRLQLEPDERLRLEMVQSASVTGNVATPLRNFVWSSCDDDVWLDLIQSDALGELTGLLAEAKKDVDAIKGASLPYLRSTPEAATRATRMFIRGNWLERGDEVSAGIPAVFFESDDAPIEVTNRLELARWLVSEQNPLAARVWANRIWAQLFERGLVETLEDFGSSGLRPTHPELLDHLAAQVRDAHGWRLKPFLRELVLSSTYRQTNQASAKLRERDPRNELLARGPRTRLSAEMIRDQSLAVAGLLSAELGGPSVMPPQPDGVWQTVYSGAQWKTATGAQRYRRALYTYWRRTSPYPSMLMFDSPTRDLCSARRIATNTPLQALVTLNDPVYVECSEALAERATQVASGDPDAAIEWMFRAATQRAPTETESEELNALYADLQAESDKNTDDHDGSSIDVPALSIVANTIFNLDRALTK